MTTLSVLPGAGSGENEAIISKWSSKYEFGFSQILKLEEMAQHIYGETNVISRQDRPNMFIKELNLYIDYLKKEIENLPKVLDKTQEKYIKNFTNNLLEGINYYTSIFKNSSDFINSKKELLIAELNFAKINLEKVQKKLF